MKQLPLVVILLLLGCQRPAIDANGASPTAGPGSPTTDTPPAVDGTISYWVGGIIPGSGSIDLHLTVLPDGQGRLRIQSLGPTKLPQHGGRIGEFVGTAPAADLAELRRLVDGLDPEPSASGMPSSVMTTLTMVADGEKRKLGVPRDRAGQLQETVLRIMAAIETPARAVEARLVVADGKARIDLVGLAAEPLTISVVGQHISDFLLAESGGQTTCRDDATLLAANLPRGEASLAAGATFSLPLPFIPNGPVRVSFHLLGPGKARGRASTEARVEQ